MDMGSYFIISSKLDNFLFKGWSASNVPSWFGICLAVVGLTLLLEACRLLRGYLQYHASANPLTYEQTESNLLERSPLLRPLVIPASVSHIRRRKIGLHVVQTLAHVLQVLVGYTLMLAVMTYNFWIILSVACASGIGYFVVGAIYDIFWRPVDPPPPAELTTNGGEGSASASSNDPTGDPTQTIS